MLIKANQWRKILSISFVGLPEGRKTLDKRASFRNYLLAVRTHYEADKRMPYWLKDQAK